MRIMSHFSILIISDKYNIYSKKKFQNNNIEK